MIRRHLPRFRQRIDARLKTLNSWFSTNSLAPEWLPERWQRPLMGYLLAVLLILLAIILELWVATLLPNVEITTGLFIFLLILFVGLNWGAGPCLLATVVGTILLYYLIYPPRFSITWKNVVDMFQGSLVLFGGLFIALTASQRENQRRASDQRAYEANKAKRDLERFLGIASHELRTPLTSILLGLELGRRSLDRAITLQKGEATGEGNSPLEVAQQRLGLVFHQSKRLEFLIEELLENSLIEADQFFLHQKRCDLALLTCQAVEEQRLFAAHRVLALHVPPEQPIPVYVDAERMRQVLHNYLSNALKYSAEETPIEVGVQVEGEQALLWVQDAGPGIPEDFQAVIWERFARIPGIEVLSGSGVGLGLGLYISRTIIERHEGQVGVQSAPGQGSRFWFRLPLLSPLSSSVQRNT